MAELKIKSQQQISDSMIRHFLSRSNLTDLNPGSIINTLISAVARGQFQIFVQLLNFVRNYYLETTTGIDLDDRAFEYGAERRSALKTTGSIKISKGEYSEQKINLFTGDRLPKRGDTVLYVNDAFKDSSDNIITSGVLVLGRGTRNSEETLSYNNIEDSKEFLGSWKITLSSQLTKDHSFSETVLHIPPIDIDSA